ncbi:3'-N-debenzoyl-2'-deoxytaxol N-benzoyltransferase-like [Hordeum vulgare]|nr:3'-N-debenzoyl-2'-deoxytaxol N-benzoyltransferase-like [Hordeum vulgare]
MARQGDSPARAVEQALARALVEYYPLAGRLTVTDTGELQVDCSDGGVWFIEAAVRCRLEDVDYLEYPLVVDKDELLPHPRPKPSREEESKLILLVQVTTFDCGGFVVGFRFSHAVADGPGAAQFMGAVGELARGAGRISVAPVWGRDAIPDPAGALVGSLPDPAGAKRLEYLAIDISADYINHFKGQFAAATGGARCSAFEGTHRQGLAEPHARRLLRRGLPRAPLLRDERAAAPPSPPPVRGRRLLRQLLLHHARLLDRREGGVLHHHRRRQDDQGGEEAAAVGVRAVGRRRDGQRGPVPDHLRLPDAARVRLDAAGLRGGGLRLGPSRPRRAADKPGLHRHVHPRQALGAQARRPPHHAVRHARPCRRFPRRLGGHQLARHCLRSPHTHSSICSRVPSYSSTL